jgi:hypothetical protein
MALGFLPWTTQGKTGDLVVEFSDAAEAIAEVTGIDDIIHLAPREG